MNPWYQTPRAQEILKETDGGKLLFTWVASGSFGTARQIFDETEFDRTMTDPGWVHSSGSIRSADTLPKDQVSAFSLIPIAYTKKRLPWFQNQVDIKIRPDLWERFENYWLVDQSVGSKIYRHVVGIQVSGRKILTVISPSGKITICGSDDLVQLGE